ncbi:MAG: glycosyltransferase family 4 protein [Terriglobales bacterium]
MNVALLIESLSVHGGTHKQLLRLAQYLRASGDRVEIVTREYLPGQCYEEFGGFDIKTDPHPARGRLGRVAAGLRLAKLISPDADVLNVHDQGCDLIALQSLLQRPSLPVVWQINDLHPAYHVGPYAEIGARWFHPAQRFVGRLVARRCRALTVNVTKNARRVQQNMGGEPEVFYCGVDQIASTPTVRRLEAPIQVLSIGVFYPYRNYETIIDALALLASQDIGAELTVVGTTKYHPEYAHTVETLARQRGVAVCWLGEVTEEVLRRTMARSHLFVFVNVDQSWGLAAFEALNMSLPVVLSESVGAVELLRDNPSVRVVDPKSAVAVAAAIADIASSQRRYEQLMATAFESVQAYTWDKLYSSAMRRLFLRLSQTSERARGAAASRT